MRCSNVRILGRLYTFEAYPEICMLVTLAHSGDLNETEFFVVKHLIHALRSGSPAVILSAEELAERIARIRLVAMSTEIEA